MKSLRLCVCQTALSRAASSRPGAFHIHLSLKIPTLKPQFQGRSSGEPSHVISRAILAHAAYRTGPVKLPLNVYRGSDPVAGQRVATWNVPSFREYVFPYSPRNAHLTNPLDRKSTRLNSS